MEILIIGGILVLVMVVVSTKIKAKAALAFEPEIIERGGFKIVKPAGLMSPVRESSEYIFEAYSKNYGEKKTRNIWQAHALLSVKDGLNFKSESEKARQAAGKIVSEKVFNEPNGEKVFLIESEKTENNAPLTEFRKIVESRRQKKTYNLQITVLRPYRENYIDEVNEMINSFQLK